jgi:aspartyl-tRNA(Asn)/glutamyl-tRNA(Gln) amidotransferase subunit B
MPINEAVAMMLNQGAKYAKQRSVPLATAGTTSVQMTQIWDLRRENKISSSAADQLFNIAWDNPTKSAPDLAQQHGLLQVSDTHALEGYVDQVLGDPKSAKAVEDIKAGKDKAVGALLGQIMKLSHGQANPKRVREMIFSKLRG